MSKRIMIIGNVGGGKTTLARSLRDALDIEVHTVDLLQWRSGWVRVPAQEFHVVHADIVARPSWIIDGWGPWSSIVWRALLADIVILVDLPLRTHLLWSLRREITSLGRPRDDLPAGCSSWHVLPRLLTTIRRVEREEMPKLRDLLARDKIREKVVCIRSPQELAAFRDDPYGLSGANSRSWSGPSD